MQNVPLSPGVFRRKPACLQFERKRKEEEKKEKKKSCCRWQEKLNIWVNISKKKKKKKEGGEKLKLRLKPKVFHQLFPQLPHRLNRVLLVIMSVLF